MVWAHMIVDMDSGAQRNSHGQGKILERPPPSSQATSISRLHTTALLTVDFWGCFSDIKALEAIMAQFP